MQQTPGQKAVCSRLLGGDEWSFEVKVLGSKVKTGKSPCVSPPPLDSCLLFLADNDAIVRAVFEVIIHFF
jgi:hypothetical protein